LPKCSYKTDPCERKKIKFKTNILGFTINSFKKFKTFVYIFNAFILRQSYVFTSNNLQSFDYFYHKQNIQMSKEELLKNLNSKTKGTLMETLDITYIDIEEDYLVATMPVNAKVHQPEGLLHGGASVALAESVGSTAAHFSIDSNKQEIRGLEITANHVRGIKKGLVRATAKPIHKGRSTQLWEIRIVDEQEKLISICKLTTIVLSKS